MPGSKLVSRIVVTESSHHESKVDESRYRVAARHELGARRFGAQMIMANSHFVIHTCDLKNGIGCWEIKE
jgi:hypothetical protein